VGWRAGVSAGTFTRYPGIEHITVCEIEPIIPPISTRYFGKQDYEVLHNPRTRIVYDDARHYLMTTTDTYDACSRLPPENPIGLPFGHFVLALSESLLVLPPRLSGVLHCLNKLYALVSHLHPALCLQPPQERVQRKYPPKQKRPPM